MYSNNNIPSSSTSSSSSWFSTTTTVDVVDDINQKKIYYQTDCKTRTPQMANRFEVDQRAALFSSFSVNSTPNSRPTDASDAIRNNGVMRPSVYGNTSCELMESENDRHMEDLEAKVQDLKSVSLALRGEVQESNSILSSMGEHFDSARGLLGGTLKKLQTMISSKSGRHLWYMVLFVVALVFFMYIFYSRR
eukprot:GHVS01019347.1.p1 GENE.GHVS01019347.1~~GHVS01019347.1.p1  ORF type:complete len:192 (-),score=36.32 GHVS01019347.1:91-666(-)